MRTSIYDLGGKRTHKSIGIEEVIQDALDSEVDTISIISSGNYLNAILEEVKRRNVSLKVVNLVNKPLGKGIELLMEGKKILRTPEEREDYVEQRIPGKAKDYTNFIPKALEQEAEKMLASNPDYISLGVGTGKLFVTLYRKIKEKGLKTRLFGVLPKGENGVFNEGNFEFTSLADKLTAPYTSFRDELLQAQSEGHILFEAEEKDFLKAKKEARKRGYKEEISGSAGFVLYDDEIKAKYGIDSSNILVVNTGSQQKTPLYLRILKPTAAIAASVLLTLGVNHGINEYQKRNELLALAETNFQDIGYVSRIVGRPVESLNDLNNKELYFLKMYEDFTNNNCEALRWHNTMQIKNET